MSNESQKKAWQAAKGFDKIALEELDTLSEKAAETWSSRASIAMQKN
jgi:hypothetical protein